MARGAGVRSSGGTRRLALALVVLPVACGDDASRSLGGGGGAEPGSTSSPPSRDDGTSTAPPDGSSGDPARPPGQGHGSGEEGSGGTATGDLPRDPVELPALPSFVEVSVAAGIDHVHGQFNVAPNCVIDQVGPGTGGFCLPERMTAGAAAADFDGDGWVDLAVTRSNDTPVLYRNEGDGTFTAAMGTGVEPPYGTAGLAWADFDNDGDQDLYLASLGDTRHYLYINDGSGVFTEQGLARGAAIASETPHAGMSVAVGDYDLDGWTDLYVAEWRTTAGLGDVFSHSRLLHNLGPTEPGSFEDVTIEAGVSIEDVWIGHFVYAGVYAFSPAFVDLDLDGYPELAIVSDFRCSRLFWNDGDGTFTDGTEASGVGLDRNGMGGTFGDYDLDGDLDWFVTAITEPGDPPENRLYRNEGARQFVEVAEATGVGDGGWGWGTAMFDPDNDGDLDLLATFGYYFTAHLFERTHLWMGDGAGGLGPEVGVEVGMGATGQGRGVLVVDYDDDGDLDVYVANNAAAPALYENLDGNLRDWLRVRAVGTTSNRDGLGAQVRLWVTEAGPAQHFEIGATGAHFMGQSDKLAHFGLGSGEDPVARVEVTWPASGQTVVLQDVPRNTEIVVQEPG